MEIFKSQVPPDPSLTPPLPTTHTIIAHRERERCDEREREAVVERERR